MVQSLNGAALPIEVDDEGYRHWSPASEKFSPADALIGAIDRGWTIHGHVFQQEYWHTAGRRVPVYHFKLFRDGEIMPMVVIENPFVTRLLVKRNIRVVRINERKQQTSAERW
jgi:hypothetical protein